MKDKLNNEVDATLFFGISPKRKQQLKKNKDQKKINLDKLHEKKKALDLDKTLSSKIGKRVRLIDLAMDQDDEFKPKPRPRGIKIEDLGLTIMPRKIKKHK